MAKSDRNISPYYDTENIERSVKNGAHRVAIGGMWDEIGQLQVDLMRAQGLMPKHKLLDIGCGSLRGGVHFVRYLEAGNYFGIDINQSLLDAGYELELDDANRKKLPRANLKCGGNFDFGALNEKFEYAIALSVFTHLPLNHIRVCLERLADVMQPGGKFLATFFELPADSPSWADLTHQPGNVTTHAASDPYHYRFSDILYLTTNMPWTTRYIGNIDHPRAQRLIVFKKQEKSSV